jgi:hypothetical protein
MLREPLESPTPGALLSCLGVFLSILAGADDQDASLERLLRGLSGLDRLEGSAALLAMTTLTARPELRRRARREIAERGHVLPRWLVELDRSQPVERAVEISTVFRDFDELVVGLVVPDDHPLTAVVRVSNEWGAAATDGYVVEAAVDTVVGLLAEVDEQDTEVRDISPADARARIAEAFRLADRVPGPADPDRLAQSRPLIQWICSLLPEGGERTVLREPSDEELDEIAEDFLASPFGPSWTSASQQPVLEEVLRAGSINGIGDPLIWSPRNVRSLLALQSGLLRTWDEDLRLDRVPDLLRDLIRYGHHVRGLRRQHTAAALRAVDTGEGRFRAALEELAD